MIRSIDDASTEIGHHFAGLRALSREVQEQFRADCRGIAPFIQKRTRASIIRDIFMRKFRDFCDLTKGAHFHRKHQLELVGLESKWLLRVKQLASGFSVGVSPTHASEQYDANVMPDYAADLFPDAPEATLLYLGWSVPENAPNRIDLYLVCNDHNRNVLWVIDLSDGDAGRGIQTPLPSEGDGDTGVGIRVRVKHNEQKANG
ncbi:MAG TPA: hypothetical protein VJM34_08260 [Novosphingobium sp.]|nr:hypothetical protein [Novosphingobium sp.]